MPGESIASMSSSMASWFTSTSLFILLNLTIGTIALIARFTPPKNPPGGENPHQLVRAPSLLERVKSFNFSLYRSESSEPEALQTPDETVDRDSGPGPRSDEGNEHHVTRTKSEPHRESGDGRAPAKMKKSASEKLAVKINEEEVIVERQRPATVRERKGGRASETLSFGDDEEVDAKADDFINRFKQQLKLQRIDSLLRYRRAG